MNKVCNHPECAHSNDYYCHKEAVYKWWNEMDDILNLNYKDWREKYDGWKDGSFLPEKVYLQFCGVALHLNPDGTYYLEDTTGG